MGCLVCDFKQQFSVFKQHYTYFHIFFHLYVFSKNTNNVTRTILSNGVFKELFSNVVLVTLFVFLEISVDEKVCENTYNVV